MLWVLIAVVGLLYGIRAVLDMSLVCQPLCQFSVRTATICSMNLGNVSLISM